MKQLGQISFMIIGLLIVLFFIYKLAPEQKFTFSQNSLAQSQIVPNPNPASALPKIDLVQKEINVVAMGRSGPEYIYDPNMTDSIMAVHIDLSPVQPKIYFISIPRDLWVQNPVTGSFSKLNEIVTDSNNNHQPEAQAVARKVSQITGLNFNNYVIFNLDDLRDVVDTLGGIKINVQDPINDPHFKVQIPSGEQVLDGYAATVYVRSRYFENGDFTRMTNQQQVLRAILDKISNLNPVFDIDKFIKLYQTAKTIDTNLGLKNLWQLYVYFKKVGFDNLKSVVLNTDTGLIIATTTPTQTPDGQIDSYILVPTAGQEDYSQIQTFIQKQISSQ